MVWRYTFDLAALTNAMVAAGLPVVGVLGQPALRVLTSRQLTSTEKSALSQWVLGAWSAVQVPVGSTLMTFVKEDQLS
jgi:hypothetical protein